MTSTRTHLEAAAEALALAYDANSDNATAATINIARDAINLAISLNRKADK